MQSFEWVDATSVEQAVQLLGDRSTLAKAGGLDLLDLMKEGILAPDRLINLKTIPGLGQIRRRSSGELEIGALVTLAQIAADPQVRERHSALAEAAAHAATPQIRNAGTIGGNLLQKPRCWYFRNVHFHRDDFEIGAPDNVSQNQYHAIFDNSATPLVHSSTPATALVAYDAAVELTGREGRTRKVPVREFFVPADFRTGRVAVIEADEVLTQVLLPSMAEGTKSAYHKQTERDSYDWPICDVAVALQLEGEIVRSAAISMGWVAPVPRRAVESEQFLEGKRLTDEVARAAARAAVAGATPLSKNSYKVPVLEAVVRRTILAAATA